MQIEPLKSLSPLCSGGRLQKQTKTKAPQSVSLPFIIVRPTAAALLVSQNPLPNLSVCVFRRITLWKGIFQEGRVLR